MQKKPHCYIYTLNNTAIRQARNFINLPSQLYSTISPNLYFFRFNPLSLTCFNLNFLFDFNFLQLFLWFFWWILTLCEPFSIWCFITHRADDKFPHLSTALMFIELNQSGDTPDDVSVLIHDYHSGCT